ncbi:MAG: deoxyribodipyrimidine photolyase, partial [Pseudomonadota bacterium]
EGLPASQPARTPTAPDPSLPTALLITEDDCKLEDFAPGTIVASATLASSALRSPRPVSDLVHRFEALALADAAARLDLRPGALTAKDPADLAKWAAKSGARQIATGFVPRGPLRDWLDAAEPALAASGISLTEWQRDWDTAIWPHATAGFFKVKKAIPRIVQDLGLQ